MNKTNEIEDLANDKKYFEKCHNRWLEKRNRKQENPDYNEEWWNEQCFACKFFIPLTGVFMDDYGACSNEISPFDKQVMFEHDGCEKFTPSGNFRI